MLCRHVEDKSGDSVDDASKGHGHGEDDDSATQCCSDHMECKSDVSDV